MSSKTNAKSVVRRTTARNSSETRFTRFKERLFQPVDALPLGVFRFLFGLLLCVEFLFVSRETFPSDYIKPAFHFTFPIFDLLGLKPLSEPYLWLIFRVLQTTTVALMLGLFTRVAFIVFTSTFAYFFFMENAVYTNHYYLIFLLSLLMCIGHSGSVFSLDSLINKNRRRAQVDYWELFLLRFQIYIVFLFGALAKMNADWLVYGAPLYLNLVKHLSFLGFSLEQRWMAVVLSWAGMLSDLGLGLLLAINRWHRLTFILLCLFNGINVFFFGLGIKTFPYLMVSSYILFLPPASVKKMDCQYSESELFQKRVNEQLKMTARKARNKRTTTKGSSWIWAFVVIYISLQILIPLRHLLYKRNLQWTHEGVNFTWRMMADHHETNWGMTIEDPRTKNVYAVPPETLLNSKQLTMMGHSPYMLFQYIQLLKQLMKQQTGITNPIIKADIEVSVNGKPFQHMFDPTCNLSEVNYSPFSSPFKDLKWILPLTKN